VTLLGEASIGSGVRRVDALVAEGAYGFQAKEHALVGQLASLLNVRSDDLPDRISSLVAKLREAEKELSALRQAQLLQSAGSLAGSARDIGGVQVVARDVGDVASAEDLRTLVLEIRQRLGAAQPCVVAVGGAVKERPLVVIATNGPARDGGLRAGALVRVAAKRLGGGGGGKDDVAQGGGTDVSALADALADVAGAIAQR
jgi:alanyl-tRNA synthetase